MTHLPVKLKATLGRPTKLTDKVVQDIVDGMATGLSAEAAAAQAGVSATTLYLSLIHI